MSASNNRRKERRRMLRAAGIPTNLNLTGSAEIDLTAAKEGEPARRPTFAMQAYTGGAINVGWGKPVIIDLAGLRAAEPIAILLDHDRTKIIGQSTKVEIAGGVVSVTGMITGGDSDPNVSQVVTHARNGFRWPVSVGVAVGKTEAVGENKTVTVNGKEFAGPAYVIRAGVLRETSFVGIGADEHASASVAASATTTPKGAQDMEFTQWLMAKYALDAEMLTAEQTVKFKAEFAGQSKPEVKPTQTPDLDAQIEERRRVSAINAKAADLGQNCNVDTLERLRDIAAQCIEAKLGVKDAELRMLRERRPDPTGPAIHTSKAPDAKVLAAAMLLNCGVSDETLAKDRDFGPGVVDAAWKHRRLSIHGLLAAGLQADGVHAPHDGQGLFNAVVEHGIRAGFSTVNLPGILGTVGNKLLLDAFTSVATTYQTIAQQSDFSNFLTYTQYRLDQTGAFAQVGTDGEIKHGKLAESSYTNKLETSGLMLTLTRQQIINDDVNALQALYGTLGKSAVIAV